MQSTTTHLALSGLFAEIITSFPELKNTLPEWLTVLSLDSQKAVDWATKQAAQGQSRAPTAVLQPRTTIFTRVFQHTPTTAKYYIPLEPLSLDALMPVERPSDPETATRTLIQQLRTALEQCRTLPPAAYLVAAQDLLRRYAWCLPSPYADGEETAVSLYDFSRIVAALTPCYQPDPASGTAVETTAVATLISGDISGIQEFIYTITARGATSGLRGRSFYLQLLTEAVARYLLHELGNGDPLPPTSIIYAGGGHFYLLVPGDRQTDVARIHSQISQRLLPHHQNLYIGIGAVPVTPSQLQKEQFASIWQGASRAVSQAKAHRYSELPDDQLAQLFHPHTAGGDKTTECRVCHYEWSATQPTPYHEDTDRPDEDGDAIRKCRMCHSLEKLGRDLRNAQSLVWRTVPATTHPRQDWQTVLRAFGAEVRVYDHAPTSSDGELWALNDDAWQIASQKASTRANLPVVLKYLVNVTPKITADDLVQFQEYRTNHPATSADEPLEEGQVKSFTLLQAQAQGIKRLGVLRMDVDNLGQLFQKGFAGGSGLVQTAALSSAISLYFEGWVGRLIREVDTQQRDVLYAIYSGGDDLFIVGAWDLLPALAHRINTDFQEKYTANNPHLHASAGISLHEGKFPLYQAARAAAAALEAAKAYKDSDKEGEDSDKNKKNAFTFLGRTLPWSAFPTLQEEQEMLLALVGKKEVGRNLLQHFQQLDAIYQEHVQKQLVANVPNPTVYWGRGQWLHVYQMSRLAGKIHRDETARTQLLALRDKLSGQKFTYIHSLGLSARWAELANRERKEEQADDTELESTGVSGEADTNHS